MSFLPVLSSPPHIISHLTTASNTTLFTSFILMFLLQTMYLPTLLTAVLPASTLLSATHHLTLNHSIKYNPLHLLHTNVLIANNVLTNTANSCPSCQYSTPLHSSSHT